MDNDETNRALGKKKSLIKKNILYFSNIINALCPARDLMNNYVRSLSNILKQNGMLHTISTNNQYTYEKII
jgi:hypothetical protein